MRIAISNREQAAAVGMAGHRDKAEEDRGPSRGDHTSVEVARSSHGVSQN